MKKLFITFSIICIIALTSCSSDKKIEEKTPSSEQTTSSENQNETEIDTQKDVETYESEQTWKNDPGHSRIGFEIKHKGVSIVSGTFDKFTIVAKTKKSDFSDVTIDAEIETNSINTLHKKRDEHLRSEDFFDVEKFPKMTFKSTGYDVANKKLTGDITIHGVTKTVELDVTHIGTSKNDDDATIPPVAGFRLNGSLKRLDFGIGTKFDIGALADDINITIDAELSPEVEDTTGTGSEEK